jgi:hypothetical protein
VCSFSDVSKCTECEDNYWLLGDNVCSLCGSGYGQYTETVKKCKQCTKQYCVDCLSTDECTRCDESGATKYYLYSSKNCVECTAEGKLILRTAGTKQNCYDCLDTNCKKCGPTNKDLCVECKATHRISYSLRNKQENNVCITCSGNSFDDGIFCYVPTDNDCGLNCVKCASATTCDTCSPAYYKSCDGKCYACPTGCTECSDPTTCSKCATTHFLYNSIACILCNDNEGMLKSGFNLKNYLV